MEKRGTLLVFSLFSILFPHYFPDTKRTVKDNSILAYLEVPFSFL